MRNLLLAGVAGLALTLSGAAAYAEPAEFQVSTSAPLLGASSPAMHEGRSAFIVTDASAPASETDRTPNFAGATGFQAGAAFNGNDGAPSASLVDRSAH